LWIIAGLGNPGREYEQTRHNLGFKAVDEVAERIHTGFKTSGNYLISEGFIGQKKVVLIKPLTFMNLSGDAVSKVLSYYKCEPEHLVVIHDDMDIETGRMKIKMGGGSGGHKGIESIIASIGEREFLRIKIGIGRPDHNNVEGYVLSKIRGRDQDLLNDMVLKAADAAESIVLDGREKAMNNFNTD
jgi:PTH1 family peptidyl-tRNA hydrolase